MHTPEAIDRFEVLRVIARGGMGELYLGWDDRLDRKVAIKLVQAQRHSELAEQRLLREAKVLGQLSHPNVVSVFEVGHFEGRVFVAMEFVEGVTLRRWLRQLEPSGAARTQAILACFAAAGRGLAAVHAAGLAHRDFKPDNVLVGADKRVRIVDFGLARSLHETCEEAELGLALVARERESESTAREADLLETPTLTEDGALLGTPRYIAPEQWLGRRGDALSDQFSFCVALYEALFEVQPFQASTLEELSAAVQSGKLRPMPRRAEVAPHVREALLRGLSGKPSDRFPSMDALLEALLPTPTRRSPRLPGVLALGLLAIVLAGAALIWSRGHGSAPSIDGSTFARLQRELVAAEHLARAEAQIEALSEAGSFALADVVFRDFAELPDHAGTSALARGWLRQAVRLEQRGELDAELDAYAAAYVSEFAEPQQLALLGLARAFMRTRQWQHLGATLDELAASDITALDVQARAELRTMQMTVLASRRDLLGAAQALGPTGELATDDAILRAAMLELGRARPTEHELDGLHLVLAELDGLDLDGDRVGELLIPEPDASSLVVLGSNSADLRELGRVELGRGHGEVVSDPQTIVRDGQAYVAVRRESTHALYRLTRVGEQLEAEPIAEYEQDGLLPASWALADLDRDRSLELYLGLQGSRRLLGRELPRERWDSPHLATDATNSVIYGLEASDLDGDGTEELAMLAGEWSAYDLRIFGAPRDGGDELGLNLLGRRKLG
ncbi:MAG TPA: serine/threonine-protein kinase, partial [Enhygromyxa sp.]|nr:serine/threonine-protein kinase [Enhygromyxa sp.]